MASTKKTITEAVPQSLQSNDIPMGMKAKVRQVSISSTTGTQKGSGKLLFVLPYDKVSITRQSMYLKARILLNYTTIPTFTTFNPLTWASLQGPGQGVGPIFPPGALNEMNIASNALNVSSGLTTLSNGYSIVQRSTVYAGGKIIDNIDFVCDYMNGLILPHCTNPQWLLNDGNNLLAVGTVPTKSAASGSSGFIYWDVCLPIPHSCFNSETEDFPQYLIGLDTPLSIEINLTPITRAIRYGSSAVPIGEDYSLTNVSLCYETIALPKEYTDSMLQQIKSSPFKLTQLSHSITQMPMSALINYNTNINMSSLRAVYILPTNQSSYTSVLPSSMNVIGSVLQYSRGASANDVASNFTVGDFIGTNVELFLDSVSVNAINLNNPVVTFAELKKAIYGSVTKYQLPSIANRLTYIFNHFAIGFNTRNFTDESTIMNGASVENAKIILTNFNRSATNLVTLIFDYDSVIIFKNGKIEVKR
jgi:hypothetical protein